MTREEFIKKYKNDCRYYFDGYYSGCIDDFLTKIYNDHEAQLKLASDVYSTDKMHMYQELKAKDDEIRRLNNLYADTIKDLGDAIIEIERLKETINTSIEEIEYAIIKPLYAEVYLNNAIRFLKDNK